MDAIEYSVWIRTTPEELRSIYVDPTRIPEWQTGSPVIEEIRGAGDQPGSTYVSRRNPGAARTTVIEADKPRLLVTSTEAYFGLRFDLTSTPHAAGGGTLLRLHTETHWPRRLHLVGRLVEAAILSWRESEKELGSA